MGVAEVERFEGVERGVIGLIRLWKFVEKGEKEVGGEEWVVDRGVKARLGHSPRAGRTEGNEEIRKRKTPALQNQNRLIALRLSYPRVE